VIDVVLPCLNQVKALPWMLWRVPDGYRATVADIGSTDSSADLAVDIGAVVVHARPVGFYAPADAGVLAAESDVVCFLDADALLDPRQLPRVVASLPPGADSVLARRRPTVAGAFPRHARWGNAAIAPPGAVAPMRSWGRPLMAAGGAWRCAIRRPPKY
jgi:glycosyltransferase involved in cell wall biosynthesis